MGAVQNIAYDKYPKQGDWLGKKVVVCFWYDTQHPLNGLIIREDKEEPWETIILLEDGRILRSTECMYAYRSEVGI